MAFAKLGLDWEGIKKFWSSRAVKISVAIFGGIVALMGIIVLVSLLVGCGATNNYTKVDKPTLLTRNIGHHGNVTMAYFTVANPTSEHLHVNVKCCIPYDPTECIDTYVVVPPRSDKDVRVGTIAPLSCRLVRDVAPGSTR